MVTICFTREKGSIAYAGDVALWKDVREIPNGQVMPGVPRNAHKAKIVGGNSERKTGGKDRSNFAECNSIPKSNAALQSARDDRFSIR